MNRKSLPKRKIYKSRKIERDMFGTPNNRAKTWGERTRDPKRDRRFLKDMLRSENIDNSYID